MTEVMQGLVHEAKRSKFSTIGPDLSEDDVVHVWQNVSEFIEKQMSNSKGVHIPGLGTFSFSQKKLDIGNNKYILIQRPLFMLSEKFAQTHGLNNTKHHTPGQIPIVQLNFSALAAESPFDRDTVESCVKEVLLALNRSVASKRNVEFTFNGIGRLQLKESKVKMKFYKEFLNSMDGSGRLVESLKNRPGTCDSVMTDRPLTRSSNNTLILPRPMSSPTMISQTNVNEDGVKQQTMPTIDEDTELVQQTAEIFPDNLDDCTAQLLNVEHEETDRPESPQLSVVGSGRNSRMVVPMAQATAVSLNDEIITGRMSKASILSKSSPAPFMFTEEGGLKIPSPPAELKPLLTPNRPRSLLDETTRPKSDIAHGSRLLPLPPSPPKSACGHSNAGQELCYLCHQREKKNIPVSFTEEREQREKEEDRLLQQYQHLQDTEAMLKDQAEHVARRHENQKMAAFNLGVAEGNKDKVKQRPNSFYSSYIFQKRPLTPPRYIKQDELHKMLGGQVNAKRDKFVKTRADEKFLERLEQVQLAEDLAAQREQYLRDKVDQQDQYKKALSAQLKFKPLPLPPRESDSLEPIFGKNDVNNEKLLDQRARANDLYKEQLDVVAQRKREAILKRLQDQKEEENVLKRTKDELKQDRATRFDRYYSNRKKLEADWAKSYKMKLNREREEREYNSTPGILVHEQCDKYHRCRQCKRQLINCGESNIWCDSRYIPGSRLIV
ncbi:coiled-coil domain-containing protein 81-like isoform X2 [Tubulanus polymorphus]|uniref:coiled-coil domain-containing protein 81-like isoform X2 n=1 Tax=Tubulanus polymorphus TaxID=672921 RepID=UPI003DA581DD